MDKNHVIHGLLLSPPIKGGVPLPNENVLELCGRSRGRLSPIITVEPTTKQVRQAIRLATESKGYVKGFKVRLGYVKVFADDPVYDPLYDYAESENLPVMYHTGDTADSRGSLVHAHPLTLDVLANKRTELKIVACHFGNPWIGDVAELIYKHPNVYADISGLIIGGSRYFERYANWLIRMLSQAVYFAGGADKVIFGSDYPISTCSAAMALTKKLEIDARDLEKILSKNAKKVFRI